MKRIALTLIVLTIMAFHPLNAISATPFTAPARFDLAGSEIGFSVEVERRQGGTFSMALNPNPAAVTGTIDIEQLNQLTGLFSGTFTDISATTTATLDELGWDLPITVSLDSDNLAGWFVWSQDAVIFDPQTLTVTLAFGTQSWSVPLNGVPIPANYKDGALSVDVEVTHQDEYLGRNVTVDIRIHLVGALTEVNEEQPWIELETDLDAYRDGDNLKLYTSLGGPASSQGVDLYLTLVAPDGQEYFTPAFTTTPAPIVSNFVAGADYYLSSVLVFDIPLPTTAIPVSSGGQYAFTAKFTEAGTDRTLGETARAPFTYTPGVASASSDYPYDGVWYGTAVNVADNGLCAQFGTVLLEITNSVIKGEGSENDPVDADAYTMTGRMSAAGEIVDGVLWEEFTTELVQVGVYTGSVSGSTINGDWHDVYGCHGTFSATRQEY